MIQLELGNGAALSQKDFSIFLFDFRKLRIEVEWNKGVELLYEEAMASLLVL